MSKRKRLWHAMSIGGGMAATPTSTLAIGAAFMWMVDPATVTAYSEGFVQFLGFGYLSMFSLFTVIGATAHWQECDCEA
jgi:hypothetical protein